VAQWRRRSVHVSVWPDGFEVDAAFSVPDQLPGTVGAPANGGTDVGDGTRVLVVQAVAHHERSPGLFLLDHRGGGLQGVAEQLRRGPGGVDPGGRQRQAGSGAEQDRHAGGRAVRPSERVFHVRGRLEVA